VARDQIVLRPGAVLLHAVEQAIRNSAHGRSIERKQLFIPVLIGAVTIDDLPEFARSRYFADFRRVSSAQYGKLVSDIAEAVLGT